MKVLRFTYGLLVAVALSLTSCDINEMPEFNDEDAYIAFTSSTPKVGEANGSIQIPVMLVSKAGLSASVTIEVDAENSTAVEGQDFTIENKTLNFDKEKPTQYLNVIVNDNDIFTGNRIVKLKLSNTNMKLGAAKVCTLTIEDDEHPLAFILGTYMASTQSAFDGRGPWPNHTITISRDADDVSKVWIANLDPYFAQYGYTAENDCNLFYATVNEEKTIISIPCGQEVGYEDVNLYGIVEPNPESLDNVIENGNIEVKILNDGNTLQFQNAFGVRRAEGGWFNLVIDAAGNEGDMVTFTKVN